MNEIDVKNTAIEICKEHTDEYVRETRGQNTTVSDYYDSVIVVNADGTVYQISFCPCYEKKYQAFVNLFKAIGCLK